MIWKTIFRKAAGAGVLAMASVAAGCSDSPMAPQHDLRPTTVEMSPHREFLTSMGQNVEFAALVRDQFGQVMTSVELEWTLGNVNVPDDSRVLEHQGGGRFIAVGEGNTVVTASVVGIGSQGGGRIMGSAPVNVVQEAADAQIVGSEQALWSLGEERALAFTVLDAGGTPLPHAVAAQWSSSDPSVARVDSQGRVRAVGDGVVTITAIGVGLTRAVDLVVDATVPYTVCAAWAFDNGLGEATEGEQCVDMGITMRTRSGGS